MEEKLLTLKELGRHAETLSEMVIEQHDKLQKRLSIQDGQIKRIWDAYTAIGNTDPHQALSLLDPIRLKILKDSDESPYWEKYKQTNHELDRLLGLLKNKDNPLDVLKETEKVIVDLLVLLNFQWEVLVVQLGSVCDQIQLSRDTERTKVAEFRTIEPTLEDNPSGMEIKKAYAFEQEQLILQQIELFESEQGILSQMEFVCDERDRLFPISAGLFLR